jgi:hypothetical protein
MRPKGKSYDVEVFQVSRARQLSVAGIDIPPDEVSIRSTVNSSVVICVCYCVSEYSTAVAALAVLVFCFAWRWTQ